MAISEEFMNEALKLASQSLGRTRPNPAVGAVLVKGDKIIAKGLHSGCGAPHAEIQALNSAENSPRGSDLYVTLEPCGHHGRTPPCSEAIIKAGIKTVFFGTKDPNPQTAGKGPAALQKAGISVVHGPLQTDADYLNGPYLKWMKEKIPLVTAKWAMTMDGRIATRTGDSKWITSPQARTFAHNIRNHVDAVLVGTKTALQDDPELTCRIPEGTTPLRVLLDRKLRLPPESRLFSSSNAGPVIVYTENSVSERAEPLKQKGIQVHDIRTAENGLDLHAVLRDLGKRSVHHLLVEGGGILLGRMFDCGFVDRICVFAAPKIAGGCDAVSPVAGTGVLKMANALKINIREMKQRGPDFVFLGEIKSS